jgi:hypothetical protein
VRAGLSFCGLAGLFFLSGFDGQVCGPFGEFRRGHSLNHLANGHVEDLGEGEEKSPLAR